MVRIDVLPDDVLLGIFDFHVDIIPQDWDREKMLIEAWQSLVHVCRRWRNLVFESPRRLNLRLFCTPGTPARTLDIWPPLPLLISGMFFDSESDSGRTDNIIAALRQSNRVRKISLRGLADWQLEKVLATMQVPFPELTDLQLSPYDETPPLIPDSFLGGSAPRLRDFSLSGIPFPRMPKLLSSTTHLDSLHLIGIPLSWYISLEVMVALLSVLSSLRKLRLEFKSPHWHARPGWETRRAPPPKRSTLLALEEFGFGGVSEYLEDLVTLIDAPQLNKLQIMFLNQINFETQLLAQFINRTPKLMKYDEAHVRFSERSARILFGTLVICMPCRGPDRGVGQVCNSLASTVEDLYIEEYSPLFRTDDAIENTLWLELLLPFTAVKNLYLCDEFAPDIAAALEELVGDRITEVLPSLQNIFVDELKPSGVFQEDIGRFLAARQLCGKPIAISVK